MRGKGGRWEEEKRREGGREGVRQKWGQEKDNG